MNRIDGLFRLLHVHSRRFAAEPETRAASSLGLLQAAIALHAAETSPGEAAVAAAEAVAALRSAERLARRSA